MQLNIISPRPLEEFESICAFVVCRRSKSKDPVRFYKNVQHPSGAGAAPSGSGGTNDAFKHDG